MAERTSRPSVSPAGLAAAAPRRRRRWLGALAAVRVLVGLMLALVAKGPGRSAASHAVALRQTG